MVVCFLVDRAYFFSIFSFFLVSSKIYNKFVINLSQICYKFIYTKYKEYKIIG